MFIIAACMITWNLNRDTGKQPPPVKRPEPAPVVQVQQEPAARLPKLPSLVALTSRYTLTRATSSSYRQS